MRHMRNGLSKAPRALVLCLMPLLLIMAILVPLQSALADEGGVSDLSLYQRASELTREFGTALAPGSGTERLYMLETTNGDTGSTPSERLVAGNAGAFLGYAEIMSDDTGIIGWLMNSYTAASATISYDQLMHVVDSGAGAGASEKDVVKAAAANNPFFQYAGYGEVLTEMGLIETVRTGGMADTGRVISTGIVLMAYLLANVAPFLFRGALMILTTLNPFQLFGSALSGAANADLGIISGIADYVGDVYIAVQNLSVMLLLPLFLALTVLSILMISKGSALQKFSRYAVRVFMIFAGLPLIGATYTGIIEDLDAQVSVGSEYADYLVLSSYVDFENWAKYSRLAPPADADILNPRFSEDETRSLSDRSLVLEINGTRAANTRAAALKDRYSATSDLSEIVKEGSVTKDTATETMGALEKSSFKKVFNLLTRHFSSTLYTSSDYNGEVSGQVQRIRAANSSPENDESIVKMFSLSSSESRTWSERANPFDWAEDWQKPIYWNGKEDEGTEEGDGKTNSAKGLFTEGDALNDTFKFGIYDMNIYNSGDLRYDAADGYKSPNTPAIVTKKTAPIGSDRESTVGGLSPIAMYNFLNTTFSNTGLTVYSPEKTSSDLSRDSYAAVTFGGSGVASWMRWIENLTVMLSLATLSIAFGLMMISVALTNIPRILSGVFGTALGSIAFITKLLISTAVLLIQIIGMMFMYTLSENIIMTMLLNFNELVDTGGSYFGAGVIFEFLGSFMVIAVTSAVTWFMIKNVKIFKEMMEEVVSNAINRLMGVLDTSTGGRGLDTAMTTGGRMGANGKLTDDAKEADSLFGKGGLIGNGGLIGGAAAMLGAAHDIEAKREQMLQEQSDDNIARNEDGTPMSLGDKLKARKATANDLIGAAVKDAAKGGVGIKGKSLERELQAKERDILGDGLRGGNKPKGNTDNGNTSDGANTSTIGQALDEHGNVVRDEFGNALNANGKPISSETGLGILPGQRPRVGQDGAVLDADGNTYTDEMGNAFSQDEKGRLIDENGQFVALDKDGVLKPVASIPGHSGKPVSAVGEAAKLDGQRFDADKFAAMQDAQAASHYGLDKDGNVIGADGGAMFARTPNGNVPVTMDRDGFVTDKDGNRMAAGSMAGAVDPRGFEEVVDPETGDTHLKHKGDAAMKNVAAAAISGNAAVPTNLTALAKQSNKANALAKGAQERVASLKANGASPYVIAQAERFANKANQNAQNLQSNFNAAMVAEGKNPQAGNRRTPPVTPEHAAGAARFAKSKQASLQSEVGKLNEMKTNGAEPAVIQRQERKVEEERMEAQQALNVAQDTQLAQKTGRSFNEVSQARGKTERAEQVFGKAQQALDAAVQAKAPSNVVQQREQVLAKAAQTLSAARSDMQRVQAAPKGSPAEIDQVTARHTQAQQQHAEAASRVQALQYQGSPQAVQAAKVEENRAAKAVTKARHAKQKAEQRVEALQASGASRLLINDAKRDVETATAQAQSAQTAHAQAARQAQQVEAQKPAPQEIQAAKRQEAQAKRQLVQAAQAKRTATSPAGWQPNAVPAPQAVPQVSPTKSFAELASAGIHSYSDYKEQVAQQAQAMKASQSQVVQARQRLASLRTSERPPQIIREAEQRVQQHQQEVKQSQEKLNNLRNNAQGLLKNGGFQPIVAARPIRKNGAAIINQMVNMGHTQAMLDRLAYQSERGTLTEAGRRQKEQLTARLGGMRRELVSAGIKEDALLDSVSITESTRHMQQSWDAFINGTSSEQQ